MSIQVGDKVPAGTFGVMTQNGPGAISSDDLFEIIPQLEQQLG